MAITVGTKLDFYFNTKVEFETKVTGDALVTGALYFVEGTIYLATDDDEYIVFGGSIIGAPPSDPADAMPGVWYYNPVTKLLSIVLDSTWVHFNNAFSTISYGTGQDEGKIFFGTIDGDATKRVELVIPKTTAIDTVTPSDINFTTEKVVFDLVVAYLGQLEGGIRYIGEITPSTTVVASAKQGVVN